MQEAKRLVEVSKDEFFESIGGLNCSPSPEGEYPYTSHFRMVNTRDEVGRIVNRLERQQVVSTYLLLK